MKTPIAVDDIRAGDLIRWQFDDSEEAGEYRAEYDGDRRPRTAAYFLLDRPTPAVELPTEPTLGWLTWRDDDAVCATTEFGEWAASVPASHVRSRDTGVPNTMVTAFTPATAVPTEALEELRRWDDDTNRSNTDYSMMIARRVRIEKFLAAVDGAK